MKYITSIILALFLASCSVNTESGELIKMPEGYTNEQTQEFVQQIVNDDLVQRIQKEFPNISKQNKGRYDFQPVILKGMDTKGTEFGVIIQVTGLEGWERRDEFKQFLIDYLKEEKNKLPTSHLRLSVR